MTQTVLGLIVSLWRYPVKSMLGEELNATEVTKRGLLGDRAYALVDSADGKVASAKNPRKWPGLFDCRAAFADVPRTGAKAPPVRVTLPDGTIVGSEQPDLNHTLSRAINHLTRPLAWGIFGPWRTRQLASQRAFSKRFFTSRIQTIALNTLRCAAGQRV